MAIILDGKKLATKYRYDIKKRVKKFKESGIIPTLAVVLLGDNKASRSYVSFKHKACLEMGINSIKIELPEETSEEKLLSEIQKLNTNNDIHGILVQLPLPKHIATEKILLAISPNKDVDGFNPINVGELSIGNAKLIPCTPLGILALIKETNEEIKGKNCLVIGRSNIVGKPIANILLKENATVTLAHSYTSNLANLISNADIIVSCTGISHLLTNKEIYKKNAIVIDVGNSYKDGKLVGDVDFNYVKDNVGYISPVPGGVGPMTITMLMHNTLEALELQLKNKI